MTIPAKGSRRLRIDDAVYTWRIRKKPTYTQGAFATPMHLAVQRSEPAAPGILVVNLGVSRPDNWIVPHQTAVTPSVVREAVERALRAGWLPSVRQTYVLAHPLIRGAPRRW